ncbi:MAG: BatD family protein [Balneolaceae bacterium]
MQIGRWRWLVFLLVFPSVGHAQAGLEVHAELSEQTIYEGERVQLDLILRGEEIGSTRLPQPPDIQGLQFVNPTPSRSQRISMINGETTTELRFSWMMIAGNIGQSTVPPIDVQVDGETYRSRPISFEIVERTATPSTNRRPDLFADMEISDSDPFVGQQLIASLVVYFREGLEITSWQPAVGWRADGFWREDLQNDRQPDVETVLLDGVRYRRARLLQFALFPTRPGTLVLQPFELQLGVRTPSRRNDPFGSVFGGLGSNQRRITLLTDSLGLVVRRPGMPETGLQVQAVGNIQVERVLSRSQLTAGDSVELVTTFRGTGNLPLITRPDYLLPASVESYPPSEESDLQRRGGIISGTRSFRQQLIPRSPGTLTLDPVTIAIFDPDQESYRYETLPALTLQVERTEGVATLSGETGTELLEPYTGLVNWAKNESYGWSVRWPLFLLLTPFLLYWTGKRVLRQRLRLQTDDRYARAHYAWDLVEERLLHAESAAKNHQTAEAYQHLHHALSGYIANRTGLPIAGLSDTQLVQEVQQRCDREELTHRLKRTLDRFVSIGYAPASMDQALERELQQTRDLLTELRRVL